MMEKIIGIRREDKNKWEKRTPIIPAHVKVLAEQHNIKTYVQPSTTRVYSDGEYRKAGAVISEDICPSRTVFAVKEIPIELIEEGKTYVFFAHVIKGQHHNMPMLQKLMDSKCNLIDYEKITDDKGRRLIFFGKHAGIAGMIDTLWALGEKLHRQGIENPFYEMRQTHKYRDLKTAREDLKLISSFLKEEGLPESLVPVVFGIAGYGNVSRGAQKILDELPVIKISPKELLNLKDRPDLSSHHVYKVVFKEKDMVEPRDKKNRFELQDYYDNPEKYQGVFHRYLPHLTCLVNAIYWSEKYPRLITRDYAKKMWKDGERKLQVISDISCDINGAVEMNTHPTDPGDPVYIFEPITGNTIHSFKGEGFVILAVDNLPCELPKESSDYFSSVLKDFIPDIASCDFSNDFDLLNLSPEIKRALIVHQGKLTPDYEYLKEYL